MWKRLRSLSRSRRSISRSSSESRFDDAGRKASTGTVPSHASRIDSIGDDSILGDVRCGDAIGISILHEPETAPTLDIIFVHGLGGASTRTWCKDHDPGLLWPKYWLPEDLQNTTIRVSTFGYNAEVLSKTKTKANITDFSKSLLASMKFENSGSLGLLPIGKIPIIFVAHSMGGLVLKKASISIKSMLHTISEPVAHYLFSYQAYLRGKSDEEYSPMISQIRAMIFLSTPHRGSQLADTLDRILSVSLTAYTRKAYIGELIKDSSTIEDLNEDFRHAAKQLDIYCFYETRNTVLRGSQSAMIVSKDSAMLGYADEKSIPLDADHHGVCKFQHKEDANYRSVMLVIKTSATKIARIFQEDQAQKVVDRMTEMSRMLMIQFDHETDHITAKQRLAPGTCQSLLDKEELRPLREQKQLAKFFWLHAGPGHGKSTAAAFLVEHLKKQGKGCQYYYFRHEELAKRSLGAFLRTIALQVASEVPRYQATIVKAFEEGRLNCKLTPQQLQKVLFGSSFSQSIMDTPLFWVIDGVDESESVGNLMSILTSIPVDLPLRILLVSRPIPSISAALDQVEKYTSVQRLDIGDNHGDIRLFVESEANSLRGSAEFRQRAISQLIKHAQGSFLWVQLALEQLKAIHSQDELENVLQEIPTGMESMYERMASKVRQLSRPADVSLAENILIWVVHSKRPLYVPELSHVLQARFPSLLNLASSASQVCGHFVSVDSANRVTLVHATAKEYLQQKANIPFSLSRSQGHQEILMNCLRTLSNPRLRSHLASKSLPVFCEYACTSWPSHLSHCSATSEEVFNLLTKFMSGPFVLLWIESLALLQRLDIIVSTANVLMAYISRRKKYDAGRLPLFHKINDLKILEAWTVDLVKIVGKFGSHIIQDPSAVHKFVPALCPQTSQIYTQFGKSSLTQISMSGLSAEQWDDLTARLSVGVTKQALLLRCSSRYLAVVTSANEVIVWDAVSLQEILRLQHEDMVLQLDFASTTSRFATYGYSKTTVWELPSGREVLSVANEAGEKAIFLQFSQNDTGLLMCSAAKQFSQLIFQDPLPVWQRIYEKVLQAIVDGSEGFTNTPSCLVIDPHGSHVAVAYRGAPSEIWDLELGSLLSSCTNRPRQSEHLSNNKQTWSGAVVLRWHPLEFEVLGLYTDGTVFKWNPLTEKHSEISSLNTSSPSEIDISANGAMVLTSTIEGTIRLYTYDDLTLVYQLSSEDAITSSRFSSDGRRLYDIREGYCNVWEPSTLTRLMDGNDLVNDSDSDMKSINSLSAMVSEAQADTSATIRCVAVHSQSSLVCTGDDVGNVHLFNYENDMTTKIGSSPLEMAIERVVWSEDGHYLAYDDLARRLKVIKLNNAAAISQGFGHTVERVFEEKIQLKGGVTHQILFDSSTSHIMAKGPENVQIWDLASKKLIASFDTHSPIPQCFNHATEPSKLLAMDASTSRTFDWTGEKFIEDGTRPLDALTFDCKNSKLQTSVLLTPSKQFFILTTTRSAGSLEGHRTITFVDSSSFIDFSQAVIPTITLPNVIAQQVEISLTVLASRRFVFVDRSFWVCTWQLEPAQTNNDLPAHIRQTSNDKEESGVTRHFFLPRHWVNASTLHLCRVTPDGTFLCPSKGEVAAIRSGLGSVW